jgi:endonuclease YncB( thermonuclease family)
MTTRQSLAFVPVLALAPRARRPYAPPGAPFTVVERVVDGDTLVVHMNGQSIKVRLIGIDALESKDPRKPVERCARESAEFLRGLVRGKTVRLDEWRTGVHMTQLGVINSTHSVALQ